MATTQVIVHWRPQEFEKLIGERVESGLDRAAVVLKNEIRDLIDEQGSRDRASAPGEPPLLQTGELHGSIEIVDRPFRRLVGSPLPKAFFLERGTSRLERRPFLRPAIVRAERAILKAVASGS